jgi:dTDP-4-amino-4,6-dideoxy-D-galactose acyltransferase
VRPATLTDIPALKRIASSSHRETRFYADRHFAVEQCNRLYELWIEKSCQAYADAVLVVDDDAGEPAGYVTCHRDGEATGHIGLFAVREDVRGRGIGRQLLDAALRWFSTNGVTSMTVATQLRNMAALQFYGRAGLLVASAGIWFHLWPGDAGSIVA